MAFSEEDQVMGIDELTKFELCIIVFVVAVVLLRFPA